MPSLPDRHTPAHASLPIQAPLRGETPGNQAKLTTKAVLSDVWGHAGCHKVCDPGGAGLHAQGRSVRGAKECRIMIRFDPDTDSDS